MGHSPVDDDPHRGPCAVGRLPQRRVGRAALQRSHRVPSRVRPLAGRPRRRRRSNAVVRHDGDRAPPSPDAPVGGRHHRRSDRSPRRRRDRIGRDRLRRCQQLRREGGRAVRDTEPEELHAWREGDDLAAEAGHRRTIRRARSPGRRHRDRRLHRRHQRWRVRLHQPRDCRGRCGAEVDEARRAEDATGGDHRRDEAALRDRSTRRGRRAARVLGAPDPRGRAVDDARR